MPPRGKALQTDVIEKSTGFESEQVGQFVTRLGDNYYINKDGRRWKMDERFGAGGYKISVGPPEPKEYAFMKQMMGIKPDEPCIIMKASVIVDGKQLAEDYGFVTPASARAGKKQFDNDGLHIAITKATNRVMGMLTAGGFGDPDNVYEHEPVERTTNGHTGYVPATGSAQVAFLNNMKKLKKEIVGRFETDAPYYEVLHSFGYEKSNDSALCSNAVDMESILRAMHDILGGELDIVHPDPEPPTTDTDFIDNLDTWSETLAKADDENKALLMADMLTEFLADSALEALHATKGATLAELLQEKCQAHVTELEVEPFLTSLKKAKVIIDGKRATDAVAE
jgi:hypothetical protein